MCAPLFKNFLKTCEENLIDVPARSRPRVLPDSGGAETADPREEGSNMKLGLGSYAYRWSIGIEDKRPTRPFTRSTSSTGPRN